MMVVDTHTNTHTHTHTPPVVFLCLLTPWYVHRFKICRAQSLCSEHKTTKKTHTNRQHHMFWQLQKYKCHLQANSYNYKPTTYKLHVVRYQQSLHTRYEYSSIEAREHVHGNVITIHVHVHVNNMHVHVCKQQQIGYHYLDYQKKNSNIFCLLHKRSLQWPIWHTFTHKLKPTHSQPASSKVQLAHDCLLKSNLGLPSHVLWSFFVWDLSQLARPSRHLWEGSVGVGQLIQPSKKLWKDKTK